MRVSKLQEKLAKVKEEFGDVEVFMKCWNDVATNYVCLVKDQYDDSFVIYITDDVEGLATVFDVEDFELIRQF